MEVLHGIVYDPTDLTITSATTSSTAWYATTFVQSQTVTSFVLVTEQGAKQVKVGSQQRALVSPGHNIVAAGSYDKNGVFNASAYRNLTTNTRGVGHSMGMRPSRGAVLLIIIGLGFIALGAWLESEFKGCGIGFIIPGFILFVPVPFALKAEGQIQEAERLCDGFVSAESRGGS
jgi:hypothetical protein